MEEAVLHWLKSQAVLVREHIGWYNDSVSTISHVPMLDGPVELDYGVSLAPGKSNLLAGCHQ